MRSVLVSILVQTRFFQLFGVVPDRIYPVERKIQSKILFLPSHCAYSIHRTWCGDQFYSTGVVKTVTSEKNNSIFSVFMFKTDSLIYFFPSHSHFLGFRVLEFMKFQTLEWLLIETYNFCFYKSK